MIKAAKNRREEAIIAVLYESGCRVGELKRIKWKDAVFDEYGIKLYITDKKENQKRYYRLTLTGKPALSSLRDSLKETPDPEDYVFVDDDGLVVKHRYCDKILKAAAAKAGITKRVHPHLLRHCRATHMKAQGYSDSAIKKAMWNNENTDQWDRYVNLSEEDQDGEFLRMSGITKEEKKALIQEGLRPRSCINCGEQSQPNAKFCWKCGDPITDEAKQSVATLDTEIGQDPDFQQMKQEYDTLMAEFMGKWEARLKNSKK
jgi:hypothetical protein